MASPTLAAPLILPGPADAGRIDQRNNLIAPESALSASDRPARVMPPIRAPEQSKHMTMTLHEVRIIGMTAFTSREVEDIYTPYIDRAITMDTVWLIAGALTERYRNAGYFLSTVTVPQQEIKDGIVTLNVIEGYIGEVTFDDPLAKKWLVNKWIEKLQSYRPLSTDQLENILLQLNDLPGVSLRAVLEPLNDPTLLGAVRLNLESRSKPLVSGQVSLDNNGSKFLGPYEGLAQVQGVLLPLQKTTGIWLSTLPWDELKYGGLKQEISVVPSGVIELYGTHTKAAPGYTLESQEIRTDSTLLAVGFNYKFIRQRQQNLTGRIAMEARDTDSDILGTPLTRDAVRALRGTLTYEMVDRWQGYDFFSGTISQGLNALGASQKNQLNLSRASATPDFTKFEANINRIQALMPAWAISMGAAMQIASGPLYSSEEFGYGGQAFGRAYDDSEITGDHGLAATAELRYTGFETWNGLHAVPYGFYDIGIIWNDDQNQEARATGSSGGAGVRLLSSGFSTNLGVAFPLTREISNPLVGNGKNPRYVMQISYGF